MPTLAEYAPALPFLAAFLDVDNPFPERISYRSKRFELGEDEVLDRVTLRAGNSVADASDRRNYDGRADGECLLKVETYLVSRRASNRVPVRTGAETCIPRRGGLRSPTARARRR
jgi:hypothetical protein